MSRIAVDKLTKLAARVLCASDTSPANAGMVAEALVAADLDGLTSHGVSRLPAYADQAKSGKVNGYAKPELVRNGASIVYVDAHTGFAFPALRMGLELATKCAQETGVAVMAVNNSHHFGVAGHHVERAADEGMVALGFGNSPAAIAPWGGAKAVFGTNPIAFAAPRLDCPPLVIDASLSKVARGKVMVAQQRGEAIPEDWALDAGGLPTSDPNAALADGTMMPLGGAKGAAFAFMVEVLAAALTGAHFGFEATSFFTSEGAAPRVGQLFVLLNPELIAENNFGVRLEELIGAISCQPGTRLPGKRRLELRECHQREGLDIPTELLQDLRLRADSGRRAEKERDVQLPDTT